MGQAESKYTRSAVGPCGGNIYITTGATKCSGVCLTNHSFAFLEDMKKKKDVCVCLSLLSIS